MERLTKRIDDEAVFKECANKCKDCIGGAWPCVHPILARLAAYEDIGLEPEEIVERLQAGKELFFERADLYNEVAPIDHLRELAQANKDGRLVMLPCKVTDTVYVIESVFNGRKCVGERVVSAHIDHVTIGETTGKPVFDLCSETEQWYIALEPEEFYLRREEAEVALKEREATHGV